MRPRTTTLVYQTAARSWLTLAGGSILLSAGARSGIWLPLHLTLAGAVSVAIAGAMQNFTATLTATGAPPNMWTWAQFATMNVGVALIALGRPLGVPAMVAVGGTSFVLSAIILLAIPFWWRTEWRYLAALVIPNLILTGGAYVTHYRAGISGSVAATAPRLYLHLAPAMAALAAVAAMTAWNGLRPARLEGVEVEGPGHDQAAGGRDHG